jgi:hypothetical protein
MNKDFVFGLLVGIAIAMTLSFCVFNFYVVKSVEAAKVELKESITLFGDGVKAELKDGIGRIKEQGKAMLQENRGELVNKIGERIKERRAKIQSNKDSATIK